MFMVSSLPELLKGIIGLWTENLKMRVVGRVDVQPFKQVGGQEVTVISVTGTSWSILEKN